jgi:hypothetical protein
LRGGGQVEVQQRIILGAELGPEVSVGHVLYGRTSTVIARSQASDDVLVALEDSRWAVVHLTWRRAPETAPWPSTTVFAFNRRSTRFRIAGLIAAEADGNARSETAEHTRSW